MVLSCLFRNFHYIEAWKINNNILALNLITFFLVNISLDFVLRILHLLSHNLIRLFNNFNSTGLGIFEVHFFSFKNNIAYVKYKYHHALNSLLHIVNFTQSNLFIWRRRVRERGEGMKRTQITIRIINFILYVTPLCL